MEGKRISRTSIQIDRGTEMARGSYGEVRRAMLEGYHSPVAVKELRPTGGAKHRGRMEIVSTCPVSVVYNGLADDRMATLRLLLESF